MSQTAGLLWPILNWKDFIDWASSHFNKKHDGEHLIGRLLISNVVYHIWFERNNRTFNRLFKPASSLVAEITKLIRLHLSTLKLKAPLSQGIRLRWGLDQPNIPPLPEPVVAASPSLIQPNAAADPVSSPP
ncbi:hypothetical protein OIU77_001104 [Salix suchowensis]|uniref:Uncharacterized protein n=1 Tax=Salix suchowensis TaxID=1278906 RepID=A0ABQ8ZGP0_9ROSI|nr:hypothetical protein OIU77_001104 [Salix suchowensis]